MLRIFKKYRPRQIARYVKAFFRGSVYISGFGLFEFDGGRLLLPTNKNTRLMQVMAEVNLEIKALSLKNFACF